MYTNFANLYKYLKFLIEASIQKAKLFFLPAGQKLDFIALCRAIESILDTPVKKKLCVTQEKY